MDYQVWKADGTAKSCTPIHSHKAITPTVTAEQQEVLGETSVQDQTRAPWASLAHSFELQSWARWSYWNGMLLLFWRGGTSGSPLKSASVSKVVDSLHPVSHCCFGGILECRQGTGTQTAAFTCSQQVFNTEVDGAYRFTVGMWWLFNWESKWDWMPHKNTHLLEDHIDIIKVN